ncbi:hypothetical protein EsH8_V_000457 [Colletotrichum jinshuiense]
MQRSYQSVSRQLRLDVIRQFKNEPLTNWRAILEVLRLWTRPLRGPWQVHARKISIETELADKLLHEVDHTIWDIQQKTRCQIELHWPKDQTKTTTRDGVYLLLSGDEEALEHASGEVSQLAVQVGSKISIEGAIGSKVSGTDAEEPASNRDETVWNGSIEDQRPAYTPEYTFKHRYEEIQKPQKWTPQTFMAYITAITNARLPSRLKSEFYGSGVAADGAALALLHAAFEDPAATKAYSVRAFKKALQFMESRGHSYRNHARDLFNIKEKLAFPMDTGVFNILLEGPVKVKDLHNFDTLLKLMARHGCLPNVQTWALFLQLMENEQVRRHIVQIMHSLGMLLDPSAIRLVAKELIVYDVHQLRENWPGIREFFQSQDAKYGRNWVSRSAMNKIMNELGRLGNLASCRDLFDIMAESSSTFPTTLTLNTVLYHARTQRNLALATAVLQRAHQHNISLNEQSYHELFALAFRLRKPNMMGLVWWFACLEGKTTWHMRSRVSNLMRTDGGQSNHKDIMSNTTNAAEPPALPSFHQLDMIPPPRNGARIATLLFKRHEGWRPETPLHRLLDQAWEVDNKINQTVKKAKQQRQESSQAAADTPVLQKITVPGIPLVLQRKIWKTDSECLERVQLDMTVTHLAPTECHRLKNDVSPDEDSRSAAAQV